MRSSHLPFYTVTHNRYAARQPNLHAAGYRLGTMFGYRWYPSTLKLQDGKVRVVVVTCMHGGACGGCACAPISS